MSRQFCVAFKLDAELHLRADSPEEAKRIALDALPDYLADGLLATSIKLLDVEEVHDEDELGDPDS